MRTPADMRPTRTLPAGFALFAGLLIIVGSAVPASAQTPAPEGFNTLILSPDPGEIVPQTTGMVSLSFIDPDRELDISSVRLFVDNADHTADASITAEVMVWVPRMALRQGVHSIVITMKDRTGATLPTVAWSFITGPPPEGVSVSDERVQPGEGKAATWAKVNGDLKLEGAMYSIGGDGADFRRQAPATGKAWFNLNGRLGSSWRWTGSTHFNSYESRTRQPVNRYRFDLRSNWLTIGVGDVTPRMQELILWGRRVRGFSVDLRTGPVNLSVVSGQSRRAVEGQLYSDDLTRVYRQGAYEQDLLAIRPYFGSGEKYQFGITVMHARDAIESVSALRTAPGTTGGGSSTVSANPLPKDNLVAGLDFSMRGLGGKASLTYNNAFSLFANDISGGPISAADLDSILESNGSDPINLDPAKYENLFILNQSMIPIDPRALTSLAQQVRGSLQLGSHNLGLRWRSVGGSYYTLGQTSLQRDRSGLRVQDSFRMFTNQLNITVGWESHHDNLSANKPATTDNSSLTLDLAWQKDTDTPGFSVGYRDYGRANDKTTLTEGGIDENTLTYSFGTFIPVNMFSGFKTRLNFNYVNVGRNDLINPLTETANTYYLFGVSARVPDRPTEFGLNYGMNTTELTGIDATTTELTRYKTTFHRAQVRGRHAFASRVVGTADLTITEAVTPDESNPFGLSYSRRDLFAGGEYYWSQTFFATLRAGFATYIDHFRTGVNSSEFTLILRLNRSFWRSGRVVCA